jgi:hypothetical protein
LVAELVPSQRPIGVELCHFCHQVFVGFAHALVLFIQSNAFGEFGASHQEAFGFVFFVTIIFNLS